ncbi:MAG: hypothetical protein Tsb0020_02210 [Haliangiales bacterium]
MSVYLHVGAGIARQGDKAVGGRVGTESHRPDLGGEADEDRRLPEIDSSELQNVPLGGAGVRLTYATSDLFAYEVSTAFAKTMVAEYPNANWRGTRGHIQRITHAGRAGAGARLRLGTRIIPTIHGFAGVQLRYAEDGQIRTPSGHYAPGPDSYWQWQLIIGLGFGLDYRINSDWFIGAQAVAIDVNLSTVNVYRDRDARGSIEGGVYIGYAWYPRWPR